MRPNVVLEFEDGYIRPMQIKDIHDDYVYGLNDPEVNRYLDTVKHSKQTYQSVADFVESNDQSSNAILWGLWPAKSGKLCGTVRLHGIEFQHLTAHIGVCLFDKTIWRKGFGKKAISIITQWSFDSLNLRWVEAGIYKDNVASQKAFVAAGYSWRYDISDKYILEGKPEIVSIFAKLNSNFD